MGINCFAEVLWAGLLLLLLLGAGGGGAAAGQCARVGPRNNATQSEVGRYTDGKASLISTIIFPAFLNSGAQNIRSWQLPSRILDYFFRLITESISGDGGGREGWVMILENVVRLKEMIFGPVCRISLSQ